MRAALLLTGNLVAGVRGGAVALLALLVLVTGVATMFLGDFLDGGPLVLSGALASLNALLLGVVHYHQRRRHAALHRKIDALRQAIGRPRPRRRMDVRDYAPLVVGAAHDPRHPRPIAPEQAYVRDN